MLNEDAKKSALLAASEGASGGTGVALPTVSSTPTVPSKGDPRKSDKVEGRGPGEACKPGPPEWEEGMDRCFCGGGHLFAECEFRAYPRT